MSRSKRPKCSVGRGCSVCLYEATGHYAKQKQLDKVTKKEINDELATR